VAVQTAGNALNLRNATSCKLNVHPVNPGSKYLDLPRAVSSSFVPTYRLTKSLDLSFIKIFLLVRLICVCSS
jgi:hypothetical protein